MRPEPLSFFVDKSTTWEVGKYIPLPLRLLLASVVKRPLVDNVKEWIDIELRPNAVP